MRWLEFTEEEQLKGWHQVDLGEDGDFLRRLFIRGLTRGSFTAGGTRQKKQHSVKA